MSGNAPHGDRPERKRRPAETNEQFTRLHGNHCRCAYCSRELTDEWSISAGYGPVCAKKHDLPWGGPLGELIEYEPSSPRLQTLRTLARRVHGAALGARRVLGPGLEHLSTRLRTAILADRRRAVLVAGGAAAGLAVAVTIATGLGGPRPAAAVLPAGADAPETVVVNGVRRPFVVNVETGSPEDVCASNASVLARAALMQVLPAVDKRPRHLFALHLEQLPLSFHALPDREQDLLKQRFGPYVDEQYESTVASLLKAVLDQVEREHPRAAMSVLGLPVEPEQAGVSLDEARVSNDRYRVVIDRLGPFVPARRFVVFGSTLDEKRLASLGLRESLRLRDGRPIVFQTNVSWRALVNAEDLDEHGGAFMSGASSGRAALHMEALLLDD